ncbi:MAG TPA: hypothetical protein VEJ84_24495 [Acidimicrobiales bacterium]|nr:hypothetical protein [Acidimicrobiales bacterium]
MRLRGTCPVVGHVVLAAAAASAPRLPEVEALADEGAIATPAGTRRTKDIDAAVDRLSR